MLSTQFHPIPENDLWWGKGFTEWTNVTKGKTIITKGITMQKLPADLGLYDLRLEEARIAQAELARQYGIYGFCYYHYWFNGKTLLQQPIEEILKTGKPDFPFMLCWANENWTRVWDGGSDDILIEQHYSKEDDEAHIKYLLKFFKDSRYIRIDGKPVFAFYRSDLLPDITATIKLWQDIAAIEGLQLYILRFESQGVTGKQYLKEGIDAAVEFQPHIGIQHMRSDTEGLRHTINKRTLQNAYFRRKEMAYKKLGIKFERDEIYEYSDVVDCEIKKIFLTNHPTNYLNLFARVLITVAGKQKTM